MKEIEQLDIKTFQTPILGTNGISASEGVKNWWDLGPIICKITQMGPGSVWYIGKKFISLEDYYWNPSSASISEVSYPPVEMALMKEYLIELQDLYQYQWEGGHILQANFPHESVYDINTTSE